jgi:hypothetical protein
MTKPKAHSRPAPLRLTMQYLALTVTDDSGAPFFHRGDVVLARLAGVFNKTIKPGDVVVLNRTPWTAGDGMFRKVIRVTPRTLTVAPIKSGRASTIRDDSGVVLGPVVLRWCQHEREPAT